VVLLCLLCTHEAGAVETTPLAVRNLSPVKQLYGFPRAASGLVPPRHGLQVVTTAEVANQWSNDSNDNELVLLDGETYVLSLALEHSLGTAWSFGVEVPYVIHRGGNLDGLIEGWHDIFGLPQAGREDAPRNRLAFLYARDDRAEIRLTDGRQGFGDVRFHAARSLPLGRADRAIALRFGVKLPSGDADDFTGSGALDASAALAFSDAETLAGLRLDVHAGAGVLWMGEGDLLPDHQNTWAGFGHFGLAWRGTERLTLLGQLDAQSEVLDGVSGELGGHALLGSLGVRYRFGHAWHLTGVIVEDLVVEHAPDVTFQLRLRYAPRKQ